MASSFEIKSTRPSVGETIVTIVRDHIDYRKQIFKLAGSDLRRTYRASALGWSWAIIKPLVTIFVYWFAFAVGLRRGGDIEGYPFVLWLISGIVPWFYMSEMLTLGTECILRNRYLVTKMKYPVSTIPTFTSISKFSVHLILMMITILIRYHRQRIDHLPCAAAVLHAMQFPVLHRLGYVCRAHRRHQHRFLKPRQIVRYSGVLAFRRAFSG